MHLCVKELPTINDGMGAKLHEVIDQPLEGYVALVGPPNSGKTSLFNVLTGSSFRTVNYPGATVDYYIGACQQRFGSDLTVIDTPGTYSLFPKSIEETVTSSFSPRTMFCVRLAVTITAAMFLTLT